MSSELERKKRPEYLGQVLDEGAEMTTDIKDPAWGSLSYEEKNRVLYERQKQMLEEFLERNAISKEQYEKSLHDLIEKMTNRYLEDEL